MRKSSLVGIAVAVVMILYLASVWAKTEAVQRDKSPAMIDFVQQQFEPSLKLLAMHPVGDIAWVATGNAVDCKFQRPEIKNCWEVYFGTNVEGPDQGGRKPGRVEVNFIVDGDAMRLVGGGQPGDMLARKGRASESGGAGTSVGGSRGGERPSSQEHFH